MRVERICAEDLQRVGILVREGHGVPQDVHLRVGVGLGIHPLLGQLLHFERHHVGRRPWAARNALEILFCQRLGVVRIEVAHQDQR